MSLTFDKRNEQIQHLFQLCMIIMKDKGPSYAGTGEANDNFYQIAKDTEVPPSKVWSIYFKKHQRSLDSFLNHGNETSEGVQENIKDMINYLAILSTMLEDSWGEGPVWEGKNQREQMEEIAEQNHSESTPPAWKGRDFVFDKGEQGAAMAPTPASSIVEVTDPVEVAKLTKEMDAVSPIVTISQQRAAYFKEFGNMDNFEADFALAGVPMETAKVNQDLTIE